MEISREINGFSWFFDENVTYLLKKTVPEPNQKQCIWCLDEMCEFTFKLNQIL